MVTIVNAEKHTGTKKYKLSKFIKQKKTTKKVVIKTLKTFDKKNVDIVMTICYNDVIVK